MIQEKRKVFITEHNRVRLETHKTRRHKVEKTEQETTRSRKHTQSNNGYDRGRCICSEHEMKHT